MSEISSGLVAVAKIDRDEEMNRLYIPVCDKWEIQTKGKGSSFRIARRDNSGERWLVCDEHLHNMLEEMATDIHKHISDAEAIIAQKDAEIERLNGECDRLAKAASKNYRDNGLPINEEFYKQSERIKELESEVLEQCRLNGMGAERELALRGQMERQDERIKGLEEQAQSLARSVMCDQVSNDSHSLFLAAIRDLAAINECLGLDPDDGGAVPIIDAIEAQSAALKLAKEVLEDAHQNINPERGYADEIESDIEKTIAAINEVLGE